MAVVQPLFCFGAAADVQYADKDNTHVENRTQRLREATGKLAAAVDEWLGHKPPLAFVLHLGDIIDGNATPLQTAADFEAVATVVDRVHGAALTFYPVVGNHCLTVGRETLLERLRTPASYRSVALPSGWRLLMLDTTDMSGHSGYDAESEQQEEARVFIEQHPLSDEHPQMSEWNGGLGSKQMRWFKEELQRAEAAGEQVIVACHHQIGTGAARKTHLAWNFMELQDEVVCSPAVRVVFSGHDHEGGYANIDGTHFVTLEAVLEAPSNSNAYAIVEVFEDHLTIAGRGTVTSRVLHWST